MWEFVSHLIDVFGGPNVLGQRLYQAYVDGSESYRHRVAMTILDMDVALAKERVLQKQLLVERLRQGVASVDDVAESRESLSEEQLLDAACESVGTLVETGLLAEVLQRMRKRGSLTGEDLEAVRRAVG